MTLSICVVERKNQHDLDIPAASVFVRADFSIFDFFSAIFGVLTHFFSATWRARFLVNISEIHGKMPIAYLCFISQRQWLNYTWRTKWKILERILNRIDCGVMLFLCWWAMALWNVNTYPPVNRFMNTCKDTQCHWVIEHLMALSQAEQQRNIVMQKQPNNSGILFDV